MKCKLVGVKNVDYTSKKTGKQVTGFNLYVTYQAENVDGLVATDFYVRSDFHMDGFVIGDDINVFFNQYGGVDEILRIPAAPDANKKVG